MKKKRPNSSQFQVASILDIRELKKLGVIVPGARTEFQDGDRLFTADLRQGHVWELRLVQADRLHVHPLTTRPGHLGGSRTYFLNERGGRSEILYYHEGRYVSRQTARLTYASQNMHSRNRLAMRRAKIDKKLSGKLFRGDKGRESKRLLLAAKASINQTLDTMGLDMAQAAVDRERNALVRQHAARKRLMTAKANLSARPTASAKEVVTTYRSVLKELQSSSQPPAGLLTLVNEKVAPKLQITGPIIDLVDFEKLGHVIPGKLTGIELGWPKTFIGTRRIFLLFDLRNLRKACVAIIIKTGRRVSSSLFWIATSISKFGKPELRFVKDAERARQLIFSRGRFGFDSPPEKVDWRITPSPERIETFRRLAIREYKKNNVPSPLREFERELERERDQKQRWQNPLAPYVVRFPLEQRYGALIDQAKAKTIWPRGPKFARTPEDLPEIAVFDVELLVSQGYFRDGELTGGDIAWPSDWVGGRTQSLLVFVDLRPGQPCIAFVVQDRRSDPKIQIFWLDYAATNPSRLLPRLRDPITGDVSRYAYFRKGRMTLPGRSSSHNEPLFAPITISERDRLLELISDPTRDLPTPAQVVSIDSYQSILQRQDLVSRYHASTVPERFEVPRFDGRLQVNRTLLRYAPDDVVLRASALRWNWAYEPAPLTAGVLDIPLPGTRGSFVIDRRDRRLIVALSFEINGNRMSQLFWLTAIVSQMDWHFVDPATGDISAELLVTDRGFVLPGSNARGLALPSENPIFNTLEQALS